VKVVKVSGKKEGISEIKEINELAKKQ